MDAMLVLAIPVALVVVVIALILIIIRQRDEARQASPDPAKTTFAVSTEGMKRCPNCGMGNLVTDVTCSSCGKRLAGG